MMTTFHGFGPDAWEKRWMGLVIVVDGVLDQAMTRNNLELSKGLEVMRIQNS